MSTSAMPFKQMENISLYLEACRSMGVTAACRLEAPSWWCRSTHTTLASWDCGL